MNFLFEDISSGETIYVYARDFHGAIKTFESHKDSSLTSDFEHLHVYVRIV